MKILIVEDEAINLELLQEALDDYGTIVGMPTGLQALAAFQEACEQAQPYDLICLDIMMPGMDGQQTLKAIRRLEDKWGVREEEKVNVMMLTALSDSHNISTAFLEGRCQAYLSKPFTMGAFQAKLEELGLLPEPNLIKGEIGA